MKIVETFIVAGGFEISHITLIWFEANFVTKESDINWVFHFLEILDVVDVGLIIETRSYHFVQSWISELIHPLLNLILINPSVKLININK